MGELPGFEFTSFEQAIAEMTVWYKIIGRQSTKAN